MEYNGYTALANAIILQAVKDYRSTQSAQTRAEVKRFFLSDWYCVLSDTNGKMIIARLEKERGVI